MRGRRALSIAMALVATGALGDERVLVLREEGASAETGVEGVVMAGQARVRAQAEAAREEARREATAALETARRHFLGSAFVEAAAVLERCLDRHLDVLVDEDRARVVELAQWAGACQVLGHDEAAAQRAFARALAMEPEAALPTGTFPTEVEQRYEAARRAMVTLGAQPHTVRSVPPGVAIVVDGRVEGVTPLTLRVVPGVHHLRLEGFGVRRWTGPLVVERAGDVEQEVVLGDASDTEFRAQLARYEGLVRAPTDPEMARAARVMGMREVRVSLRDGRTLRWPRREERRAVWPWVVAGSVVAAGLGVGLYFFFSAPSTEIVLVSP